MKSAIRYREVYFWSIQNRRYQSRGVSWLLPLGEDSAAAPGSSCTISSVYLQHQMQREHRGGQDGVAPRTVGVAMRPRMDVIVPFGLDKFLSSVCQRPRLFEQLCHALWEMERSGREYASMPGWYRDTCLIIAVSCVRLRLCSTCHVSATI